MTTGTSTHRLRDGSRIRCRPLRDSDRAKLLDSFDHFSPDSRYRRFFTPTPRLTPGMLERLFDLDGHDRYAVGAERLLFGWLPGAGLGIARFVRLPGSPDTAEIAVAIVDEAQGQGLGTILMHELAVAAHQHGVGRFAAWVQPDNEAMKALIVKLDPHARARHEDGLVVYDFAVPSPVPLPTARTCPFFSRAVDELLARCAAGLGRFLPGRRTVSTATES